MCGTYGRLALSPSDSCTPTALPKSVLEQSRHQCTDSQCSSSRGGALRRFQVLGMLLPTASSNMKSMHDNVNAKERWESVLVQFRTVTTLTSLGTYCKNVSNGFNAMLSVNLAYLTMHASLASTFASLESRLRLVSQCSTVDLTADRMSSNSISELESRFDFELETILVLSKTLHVSISRTSVLKILFASCIKPSFHHPYQKTHVLLVLSKTFSALRARA